MIPCVVCKNKSERHHIRHQAQGTIDDEFNILNLCRVCHILWHQVGPSKVIAKYPHIWTILQDKGWYWLGHKLFNDKLKS